MTGRGKQVRWTEQRGERFASGGNIQVKGGQGPDYGGGGVTKRKRGSRGERGRPYKEDVIIQLKKDVPSGLCASLALGY